jgi:hypothetical protein
MKQLDSTERNSLPGDLAVWDGHVATVVGKLLMAFRRRPQVVSLRLVAH